MLRETVTVSFGEGNSEVNAAWEHGDFDGKQDTDNECSDFCFNNVLYTLQKKNIWLPSVETCRYTTSAIFT